MKIDAKSLKKYLSIDMYNLEFLNQFSTPKETNIITFID